MRQGGTDRALLGHRVVSGENDEEEGKVWQDVKRCGKMRQRCRTVEMGHLGDMGQGWTGVVKG